MALSKEDVLAKLKECGVQFQTFEHAPVMTADAQAAALKDVDGIVTKNLFIRDKKRRQYLITALPDTNVDLKVLSARLGCGKGGLSWGSEELLAESLQVEPGCVTPLAVANASAKHVLLLLDSKLRSCGRPFFVHPLVNSVSVLLLDASALDAYISAAGRQPIYVDLEADPKIDRDNPPDLKQYADTIEPPPKEEAPEQGGGGSSSSASAATAAAAGVAAAVPAGKGSSKKASAGSGKGKQPQQQQQQQAASNEELHIQLTNVVQRTESLIDMVAQALLGKVAAESGAESYVLRRLKADVQMELTAFKNAAFTSGYNAGKGEVVAFATRQYA